MKACALVDSTKKTKLASHALTSRAFDFSSCKRLVFRLFSAPKRLLVQTGNGMLA